MKKLDTTCSTMFKPDTNYYKDLENEDIIDDNNFIDISLISKSEMLDKYFSENKIDKNNISYEQLYDIFDFFGIDIWEFCKKYLVTSNEILEKFYTILDIYDIQKLLIEK